MQDKFVLEITLLIILIFSVLVLAFLLRNQSKYQPRGKLLTKTEATSFRFIERQLPSDVRLFAQVRIADVLNVSGRQGSRSWWNKFRRISSKHVDLVIADNDFRIICCIEIDDKSHERADRIERDKLVNSAFDEAGVLLFRCHPGAETQIIPDIKGLLAGANV